MICKVIVNEYFIIMKSVFFKVASAIFVGFAVMFASCSTPTELTYVKDAPRDSAMAVKGQVSNGIQPNDLLYIYVGSQSPAATALFNEETNKIATVDGVVLNPNASMVTGYLVSPEGDIIFPVLGRVHVQGMSFAELATALQSRLISEGHIRDAVVTVKLMNFKVSVLGEVARPGRIEASGERLTIFEAISMVGDLTIYGQRNNVTVIREENGMRTIGEIDLTSKDVFNSPYYYLHQNDVVFVEPNKKRRSTADRDPILLTYISSGVSIVSTIASVFYYYFLTRDYAQRLNGANN